MNECKDNKGGCEHKCVNTPGSFRCECPKGMKLDEDRFTCKGELFAEYIYTRYKPIIPSSLPSPSLFEKATSVNREKGCHLTVHIDDYWWNFNRFPICFEMLIRYSKIFHSVFNIIFYLNYLNKFFHRINLF